MYLTRGQPVVYYGDEQGFVGDGGDKDARQDMFASQVAIYNDDDLIGTDATTAEDNFDPDHPIYQHLVDLSALRDEHPALADGAQIHRYASDDAGVYAFSRIDAEDQVEYVVATNNSTERQDGDLRHLQPQRPVPRPVAGRHREPRAATARAGSPSPCRRCRCRCGRPPRPAEPTSADAPTSSSRPRARAAPSAAAPRSRVAVPAGGFNQVTFAWRPVGARRLDGARHRRQRPVPRLPRRHRPGEGHAGGVPRDPAGPLRQPVGGRHPRRGRRPAVRAARIRAAAAPSTSRTTSRSPAASTARSAAPATGARPATRPSSRWTRRTTSGRAPSRCRPATTSTRSPSTARGPRTTASAASATAPNIPLSLPAADRRDVLLRPRHALGHHRRAGPDRHHRRARSRASWAARATGTRRACGRGCRTSTATAPTRSSPPQMPAGSYEAKVDPRAVVGRELRRRRCAGRAPTSHSPCRPGRARPSATTSPPTC